MYTAKFNQQRQFGVEIEVYNIESRPQLSDAINQANIACQSMDYTHATRRCWKIITDSSITGNNGCEIVSPPLQGLAGIEQVKTVMDIITAQGGKVNKSCGFHVHWDCRGATGVGLRNILAFYAKFEPVMDFMVAPSRRNNRFCVTVRRDGGINWINTLAGDAQTVAAQFSGGHIPRSNNRYAKLNLNSYLTYGTVEFRQHQGTLNGDKAAAWIVFTQCIVERGLNMPLKIAETAKLTLGETFRALRVCPHHTNDSVITAMVKVISQQYKKFKNTNATE